MPFSLQQGVNNIGKIGGFLGNAFNSLKNFNNAPTNAYGVQGYTPGASSKPPTNPGIKAKSPTDGLIASPNSLATTQVKSTTSTVPKIQPIQPPSSTVTPGMVGSAQSQLNNQAATNIQGQVSGLQAQQQALSKYGLTDTSQLTQDASGNYVPVQNNANSGGNTAGGNSTNPTPATPATPVVPGANDYGGLIGYLLKQSSQPSPQFNQAFGQAQGYNDQLTQSRLNEANSLAANAGNPIPLEFQQGRGQIIQNQYTQQQAALGAGMQGASTLAGAANTQQDLQRQGLTSAIGAAQPQLAGYNQQSFNPVTGQFSGGGAGGSMQDQVALQVQKLRNHSTSYAQSVNDLSAYGQAGINALQAALGPDFNINESNAQGAAQAQNIQTAGQTSALVDKANQGLDSLQQAYDALGGLQKTGGNWLSDTINSLSENTGIGKTQTDNFNRVLNEVRASVQSVLSTAVNLGVVKSGTTVDSLLPRNMSPDGLKTAITTVKSLMEQTKNALANANNAQVNQGGGSSSNVQYNNDGTLKAVSF